MKIAFVTVSAPYGPKETYINNELEEIERSGLAEIVIFPLKKARSVSSETLRECVCQQNPSDIFSAIGFLLKNFISALRVLLLLLRRQTLRRFLLTLICFPKAIMLCHKSVTLKIDHIHAYWATTPATCAFIASQLTGLTYSLSGHRADIQSNDVLALKVKNATLMRCISKLGKEQAIEHGADPHKIHVIHLGVNIPDFRFPKSKDHLTRLVNVGDLVPIKQTEKLIEKIKNIDNSHLTIYGDGPLKRKLLRKIIKLGLQDKVNLAGRIEQDNIFKKYHQKAFDLFVLPSSMEGIPVSVMEAMAYSIPVAVRSVGATRELSDSYNAYLLDNDLNNLDSICKSVPEKSKLFEAHQKVAKEFNIKSTAKEFIKIINERKKNYLDR